MNTELTPDEKELLDQLETLFEPEPDEAVPTEFSATLKQQVRDRLAPERMSIGETMALTVIAVTGLGMGGVHSWSPVQMVGSAVVVWVFLRIAPSVWKRSDS